MSRPIHTKTDRHGRHYETHNREILVVSRRYPGEVVLWAHVRPLGSTADFIPVNRDPHGGPGALARVLKEAQDFPLPSKPALDPDSTAGLLAILAAEEMAGLGWPVDESAGPNDE